MYVKFHFNRQYVMSATGGFLSKQWKQNIWFDVILKKHFLSLIYATFANFLPHMTAVALEAGDRRLNEIKWQLSLSLNVVWNICDHVSTEAENGHVATTFFHSVILNPEKKSSCYHEIMACFPVITGLKKKVSSFLTILIRDLECHRHQHVVGSWYLLHLSQ